MNKQSEKLEINLQDTESANVLVPAYRSKKELLGRYIEDVSHGTPRGYRAEMEKRLGRKLKSNEFVHHINKIQRDNRPENLVIVSPLEHSRIHAKDRIKAPPGWSPVVLGCFFDDDGKFLGMAKVSS